MLERYSELINLIKKAHAGRKPFDFSKVCNIDSGHLSRILKGKFKSPPSPVWLKKIAENSLGQVTLDELMFAAGYLNKNFNGHKLIQLRNGREIDEYSKYLGIDPIMYERYEQNIQVPDDTILEVICIKEGIDKDFFNENRSESISVLPTSLKYDFMDSEMRKWVENPDNLDYIKFIYNAHKKGITKELLKIADISIKMIK